MTIQLHQWRSVQEWSEYFTHSCQSKHLNTPCLPLLLPFLPGTMQLHSLWVRGSVTICPGCTWTWVEISNPQKCPGFSFCFLQSPFILWVSVCPMLPSSPQCPAWYGKFWGWSGVPVCRTSFTYSRQPHYITHYHEFWDHYRLVLFLSI